MKHQPPRFPAQAQTKKINSLAIGGLAACLLVLMLVVGLALWLHRERDRTFASVSHTHDVTLRILRLLSLAQDAETGQRGYLLTGDEHYLEPFESASANIHSAIELLLAETADNASK